MKLDAIFKSSDPKNVSQILLTKNIGHYYLIIYFKYYLEFKDKGTSPSDPLRGYSFCC